MKPLKRLIKKLGVKILVILALVILIEVVILNKSYFSSQQIPGQSSTATVELRKDGFYPEEIQIKKRATVKFTNKTGDSFWPASNTHPTHTIYPEFDPKQPIQPNSSWSFTFNNSGSWRYHDHLNPNYTGVITVLDGNKNAEAKFGACEKVSVNQKQKCWDDLLALTIKQEGLDSAFELFNKLYQTDPTIPKACHGWAHILGKSAYELFRDKKDFILKKETSYCGYGFFHGFIERLLQDTKDLKATRDFCKYASEQLKNEAPGVYRNCLHGIGHGSIDVDTPTLWGNFQAMLETGLKTCDATLTDKGELNECYDGSFNAMQQYAYHGEHKLSIDRNDLFKYCRTQKEQYLDPCYYEFTGLIAEVTNRDFKKAANMILGEASEKEWVGRTIMKLSADFFQDDIANTDYTKNVLNCRALPNHVSTSCFSGILLGFIAHGEPNKQYVKGLEFCHNTILSDNEKDLCYKWILGQTVKKDSPTCKSVDEQYQQYCRT